MIYLNFPFRFDFTSGFVETSEPCFSQSLCPNLMVESLFLSKSVSGRGGCGLIGVEFCNTWFTLLCDGTEIKSSF